LFELCADCDASQLTMNLIDEDQEHALPLLGQAEERF
jgi:hypothetical protein